MKTPSPSASSSKKNVKNSTLSRGKLKTRRFQVEKPSVKSQNSNQKQKTSPSSAPVSSSAPLVKVDAKSARFQLSAEVLVKIHDQMVKARLLEERLIKMYKQNDGYFWIGGPGEESFSIPLGMQVKKGQGLDHDFLHLHYRSLPILTTMGMDPIGAIRLMKNTALDPHSGGRNFGNHFSIRSMNVIPISSTIETQYLTAIGTGIAQKQHGGNGITIVNGGDAGSAEGDFASCLIWSSRPGNELPMLIIVTNNKWGISTPADTQHGEKFIHERGTAFGIKNRYIHGNDVEQSYFAIKECMEYIRTERKPFLLESRVSRLYGHSSATGCNYVSEEEDCLTVFEAKLAAASILSPKDTASVRDRYNQEFLEMAQKVKLEPLPDPTSIYDYVYYGQRGQGGPFGGPVRRKK